MDICTAFLGVDLEEEIFMHPPLGYLCLVQTGTRYCDPRSKSSQKMVLCLRKSPYGLKQSSNDWDGSFQNFVILIGFMASHIDGGLFVLENQGTGVTTVFMYIDGFLIIGTEGMIGQNKDQMKSTFWMHDLGIITFYLGMNIECSREHHTIDIHQQNLHPEDLGEL